MAATRLEDTSEMIFGQLAITVSEQGTTTAISLRGEWDLAQKTSMRRTINDAVRRSPGCLVLDLSGLSFIDSTGVHGIIELHKRTEQQNARLVIVPGPQAVQRTFELAGLSDVLPFLTDRIENRAARPRSVRPRAAGSGGFSLPPSATPAAKGSSGRRR